MKPAKTAAEVRPTDWLRPSVVALVLANLVPLVGVIALGWEVFPLMLLFWCENVVIGALNALKMLCASPREADSWVAKVFMIPFFCFHYGMFTLVHGIFVVGFFGGELRQKGMFPDPGFLWSMLQRNHLVWAVAGLAASHGFSFGYNYLWKGEFHAAKLEKLMMQPYGRILVLHLALLLGGFLMLALKSPALGLALLLVLKIGLDLSAHLRERQKFADDRTTPGEAEQAR